MPGNHDPALLTTGILQPERESLQPEEAIPDTLAIRTVGVRIARARQNAGYRSQGSFAKALGVSRGLVGQWESHNKMPGRDNLAKVAALTAVSMEHLLGSSGNPRMSISTEVSREVKLLLRFRRLSMAQQESLANLIDQIVDVRENV